MRSGLTVWFVVIAVALILVQCAFARSDYWSQYFPLNLDATTDTWAQEKPCAATDSENRITVIVWSDRGDGQQVPSKLKARRVWYKSYSWIDQVLDDDYSGEEKVIWTSPQSTPRTIESSIASSAGYFVVAFTTFKASGDTDISVARSTFKAAEWFAPIIVNSLMQTETRPDVGPHILYDARDATWYLGWSSATPRDGTGTDLDVALAKSTDDGQSWTNFVWANEFAANDTADETNVRLVPGPRAGCIHILYTSNGVHGTLLAGTDGDIFMRSTCDGGLNFNGTRTIAPAQMLNPANADRESSFDACGHSNGTDFVVVYRVAKAQSNARFVKSVASHDGGASFTSPETILEILDATEPESAPSCKTDNRGLYVAAFGTRTVLSRTVDSDYAEGVYLEGTFVDTQNDIDVFYSIASTKPSGARGTGWSVPYVSDVVNSKNAGDNDEPVLIRDFRDDWQMVSTSSMPFVRDVAVGTDKDILFQRWATISADLCHNNGVGLTSYCPPALQAKIDSLPENMANEVALPVAEEWWFGGWDANSTEVNVVRVDLGRKVRIVRSYSDSEEISWKKNGPAKCSFPYFYVDDAASSLRFDFVDEGVSDTSTTFVVLNRGNSPNVFLQHDPDHGYHICGKDHEHSPCPSGFRPPEITDGPNYFPKYCVPCPAGRSCDAVFQESSSPSVVCPAGRYCPAGTFNPELSRCDVLRYYTTADTGMQSRNECASKGTPCKFGFWCAPGTLEADYVRILNDGTPTSVSMDQTLVYPASRTTQFTISRTTTRIRPDAFPDEDKCYVSESQCDNTNQCMTKRGWCRWGTDCNDINTAPVARPGDPTFGCTKHLYFRANDTLPPWLVIQQVPPDGGTQPPLTTDTIQGVGVNQTWAVTIKSQVQDVPLSDILTANIRIDFMAHWETFPYARPVMLPIVISARRAVTTVILNPPDRIDVKRRLDSSNYTINATMFNMGCLESVTWTARTWDCSRSDVNQALLFQYEDVSMYPVPWVTTTAAYSSGFIDVGDTDPDYIQMRVAHSQLGLSRATRQLGLSNFRACVRIEFLMSGDTSRVLRQDLGISLSVFEDCPPGTYSELGTSENGPCTPCEAGSYAEVPGSTLCLACPESFPRSPIGATSVSQCRSAPGYLKDVDYTSLSCTKLGAGVNCLDEGLTLETVPLYPGFWRSHNQSKVILRCPNRNYCLGGMHGRRAWLRNESLPTTSPTNNANNNVEGRRRILSVASDLEESTSYCLEHHRGPFCQVCEPGYVRRGLSPCSICDAEAFSQDRQRLGWTIFAATLLVVVAFLVTQRNRITQFTRKRVGSVVAQVKKRAGSIVGLAGQQNTTHHQLVPSPSVDLVERGSGVVENRRVLETMRSFAPRDLARTVSRRLRPISTKLDKRVTLLWGVLVSVEASTTLRILVSLFQVVGGISKNFGDIYPEVFVQIASAFNALSAEIFYNIDFACVLYSNHYLSLVLGMIAPVIATLIIIAVHFIFERRIRRSGRSEDIPRLRSGSFSLFLILLFLIYPSVSATIVSTFVCRTFDDGTRWLRKDIRINCDAPERGGWLILASFGVVIYVVGIPLFYTYSLVRVRHEINPPDKKQVPDKTKFAEVLFLTEIYKREYWYWEVFELIRKLLQTSLIIFFLDGSALQMIVMMVVSMTIVQIINELKPYVQEGANRLASVAQWEILIVSFIGLLLRVDLEVLDQAFPYNRQEMLTGCLVAACFMAPSFALIQKRREVYLFACVRRCGMRKASSEDFDSGSKLDSSQADESDIHGMFHWISPWKSAAKASPSTRPASKDEADSKRDTSSVTELTVPNPISVLERTAQLSNRTLLIATTNPAAGASTDSAHGSNNKGRLVSFDLGA